LIDDALMIESDWLVVELVDVDCDVDKSESERRRLGAVVGRIHHRSVVTDWLGAARPRVGGMIKHRVSLCLI